MDYPDLIERAATLVRSLEGEEARAQATRVIEVARELAGRERTDERLLPAPGDLALRRELGGLVERLGRRQSRALPLAALGRAALADLAGDRSAFRATCAECDEKLRFWGV